MEPLTIQLENNYYTLPPEAYTFTRSSIFQKMCTVAISYTDSSGGVYILGDTFLRNFLTTFDYENGKIELSLNVNAPPGITVEFKLSPWMIFGIIAGGLVVVVLIAWIACCCCDKIKKRKLEKGY